MSSNTEIPPSTPDDLAETADLIKGLNRRVATAEVDVRDYQALKTAVDGGVEQLGRLDIIWPTPESATADRPWTRPVKTSGGT